ncbi:MAG: hypothetical protein MRJ92_14360 [Nitrospira sp.]|nr:hypothetical protein [Nitrospira sp.]
MNDLRSVFQLFVLYRHRWRGRQTTVPQDDLIDNVTTLNAPLSPEPIAPRLSPTSMQRSWTIHPPQRVQFIGWWVRLPVVVPATLVIVACMTGSFRLSG